MTDLRIENSLYDISRRLFTYLSNHPLLYYPLVKHPVTGDVVNIEYWRQAAGLATQPGLVCSIFPNNEAETSTPHSSIGYEVSSVYKPHTMGGMGGYEQACFNFIIRFSMQEVSFDDFDIEECPVLITDNLEPRLQEPIVSTVRLAISPPLAIISNYMELTRLALYDNEHSIALPGDNIQVLSSNYSTSKWEDSGNVYFHQGSLLIALDSYVSRGWRDRLRQPLERFTILDPT